MGVELNAKTLLEKFKTGLGGSQKTGNGQQTREAAQTGKLKNTDIFKLKNEGILNRHKIPEKQMAQLRQKESRAQ